jgi:hypothetical protein
MVLLRGLHDSRQCHLIYESWKGANTRCSCVTGAYLGDSAGELIKDHGLQMIYVQTQRLLAYSVKIW